MKRATALVGVIVVAAGLSACAPQAPTSDMTMYGTHNMPGPGKIGAMSNKVMPERSPDCSPEALATMPPEHRAACGLHKIRSGSRVLLSICVYRAPRVTIE